MAAGSAGVLFGGEVPPWDEEAARVAFEDLMAASAAAREDDIFAPTATITCRPGGAAEIVERDDLCEAPSHDLSGLGAALARLAALLPLDTRPDAGVEEVLCVETWMPLLTIVNAGSGERLDLAEGWVAEERPGWVWSEVRSKCEGRVRAARLAAGGGQWEASLGRRLVRQAHGGLSSDGTVTAQAKDSFLIEPGVVRLVELAEAAGALPLFSCEGHPGAETMEPETQLLFRPDRAGRFSGWLEKAGFKLRPSHTGSFERLNATSPTHADFEGRDAFLRRACGRIEAEMGRAGLATTA